MSKTVLITGAGRGIGLHLAKLHAAAGWNVLGTYRDAERASGLLDLIGDNAIKLDVMDEAANKALPAQLGGKIDRLINNAGVITTRAGFEETSTDLWLKSLHVNTVAPVQIATACLPIFNKDAQVVNISSRMGSISQVSEGKGSFIPMYRASKAALNMAMVCFQEEHPDADISVYLMHPGWVRTEMGGEGADLSVEESAQDLFSTMNSFTKKEKGGFFNHDGKAIAF